MILIEKAQVQDISIIREIAYKTWPSTFKNILSESQIKYMLEMMYSEDSLNEQINRENHNFYLAKENSVALGFISIEFNYKNSEVAKIHKIYILPNNQGKGIGKKLMNKALELAKAEKQKSITLNVNRFNSALEFYQNLGYKNIASEDIDIGNNFLMEDFVLEKII